MLHLFLADLRPVNCSFLFVTAVLMSFMSLIFFLPKLGVCVWGRGGGGGGSIGEAGKLSLKLASMSALCRGGV